MKSIEVKITPHLLKSVMATSLQEGAVRFALWFYPEMTGKRRERVIARFRSFIRGREVVQPITLYGDISGTDGCTVESMPITFNLTLTSIEKMAIHFPKLLRTCDSVATYHDNDHSFRSAIIFHERQVLLQDK